MHVTLDPTALPSLDIVGLAQAGQLLRAERETPPQGIPAFVTQEGWNELLRTHAPQSDTPHTIILPALEKAVARLLAHTAEAVQNSGSTAPVVTLQSDLFPSDPTLILAFVRDISHHVACAIIGTPQQISTLLVPSA